MMRFLRFIAFAISLACAPASAYVAGGSAPVPVHTGQVSTRSIVAAVNNTGLQWVQTRYASTFRTYVTRFKIVLPCWYAAEVSTGADCTVKAGIEYPAGVFTQVTFGGIATGTITDGTELVSDWINVVVQNGDVIYPRVLMNNAVGIVLTNNIGINAIGDAWECSASASPLTDKTMGGTLTNAVCGGLMYVPIAIIAETRRPSVCFPGDSISWGIADNATTGDRGMPRLVGSSYAYISMGVNGESLTSYIANHTRRVALANSYCTHKIVEYGLNDINASASAAAVQANLQTVWGYFNGAVFQTTYAPSLASASPLCPGSASAGPLNSGQTPIANEAARVSVNTYIRTAPAPLRGFFEFGGSMETSLNSGKWLTDGSTCLYSADGLHLNFAGYNKEITDNAIPLSSIVWPYLLRRDLQPPAANDNEHEPAFLDKAA